ncbi:hypothetical protein [Nodularia spumigena]|uniref:Holin n=1 Tax=Nodularia spumigena UHCC 0039 TaxID=1914872 RepID=A0A2S0Q595_NODSP|nr:hypothetical protein [Nodularia spumigena]AVZ29564.1 hypothetical protein BMF81_00263 [Nodularia spumigena UHCC 0039]
MVEQTDRPTAKVFNGAIAGFFVTVLVFVLNTYVISDKDKQIPPEITAVATTLFTFIVSYITTPGKNETVKDGKSALEINSK